MASEKLDIKAEDLEVGDELIAERRSKAPGDLPDDLHGWRRSVITGLDTLSLWVGKIVAWMVIPVIIAMVYEVVARKLFVAPTDWAYDISRMTIGAMFMLGAGYALMRGVHIRADFLYRNWKVRNQARLDLLLYLLFFFPGMGFFLWVSADYWWASVVRWERTMDTAWMAPLAPARTAMPLGALFLILQGISEVLKCEYAIKTNRWP